MTMKIDSAFFNFMIAPEARKSEEEKTQQDAFFEDYAREKGLLLGYIARHQQQRGEDYEN
jgi:hypothetical protein